MSKQQFEEQAKKIMARRRKPEPTPPQETPTPKDQDLTTLSKQDLQEICVSRSISYKDKDPMKILIKKIEGK